MLDHIYFEIRGRIRTTDGPESRLYLVYDTPPPSLEGRPDNGDPPDDRTTDNIDEEEDDDDDTHSESSVPSTIIRPVKQVKLNNTMLNFITVHKGTIYKHNMALLSIGTLPNIVKTDHVTNNIINIGAKILLPKATIIHKQTSLSNINYVVLRLETADVLKNVILNHLTRYWSL